MGDSLKINDITVSYVDHGSSEYPVVFIHGFPFNKDCWQPQIDFLKQTQRVIAYDIRGFGDSDSDGEKDNITLYADDLIKFMDALGIKEAIVCGLSMGGYIVLNAVDRYPERFKAIILSDTQCAADTQETKDKRYKAIEQIEEGKLAEYISAFIKTVFFKETLSRKKQLVENVKNGILATSPKTIIAALKAMADREEKCSVLNKIIVPALIICGKEDALTPIAKSEILFNGINNSALKIISDAGHLCNLEQPDEFNKCVANFIATLIKEK